MAEPGSVWLSPREAPPLEAHVVHVWLSSLDQPDSAVERLRGALDAHEVERASGFLLDVHGRDFIVGRGSLRVILGRYLGMRPEEVELRYGPWGKPVLEADCGKEARLRFSLSHSGRRALYAFTFGRQVGVDIEYTGSPRDIEAIADGFFSPREYARFRALPSEMKREAFFRCWTRKEAYLKARGAGFSSAPDRFEVSLLPGEPAALLRVGDDPDEPARWAIHDIPVSPDYPASLAVEGRGCRVVLIGMQTVFG